MCVRRQQQDTEKYESTDNRSKADNTTKTTTRKGRDKGRRGTGKAARLVDRRRRRLRKLRQRVRRHLRISHTGNPTFRTRHPSTSSSFHAFSLPAPQGVGPAEVWTVPRKRTIRIQRLDRRTPTLTHVPTVPRPLAPLASLRTLTMIA